MAVASFVIAFLPADVLSALASDSSVGHPDGAKLDGSILLSLMAYDTMLLISGGISSLALSSPHTSSGAGRANEPSNPAPSPNSTG